MAPTPHVKIVKTGSYRGSTQQFSNAYHFAGGTPADTAHWDALFDAIVTAEKAIYSSSIEIVEAVGYAATGDVAVATKGYSTAGTLSTVGGNGAPLDVAALLRYTTDQRTSKNHPIYLFNYIRGITLAQQGADDPQLQSGQLSAINTYGSAWLAGFSDGTNTYTRAGPNGAVAQSRSTSSYPHHRDFPT